MTGLGPLRTHFQHSARRGLTKFVGRERELAEMKRATELVRGGRGQIVAIVAEAGTGKSRLVYEFKAILPAECKVLEAYSVSHGKASAWLPVLELLRSYFVIQDVDDPAARREKVRAALTALDPAFSDMLPYLWGLLESRKVPTRWRRWTGRSRSGGRWKPARDSARCLASRTRKPCNCRSSTSARRLNRNGQRLYGREPVVSKRSDRPHQVPEIVQARREAHRADPLPVTNI